MSLRYFISDLHLGPDEPGLNQLLRQFLAELEPEVRELWILGDLFESWIGDDDDQPWLSELADDLRALAERGIALHFLHGNRDFLLGPHWAERAGITLHAGAQCLDVAGCPTLVMHGDELCLGDTSYQQFRTMVRNPPWQQQVLSLPLLVRRLKAEELRKASREQTRMKATDIMDVDPVEVARVMHVHGVRRLIHGHTHRPAIHQDASGQRIVLGDWGPELSYLRESPDGLVLGFAGKRVAVPS